MHAVFIDYETFWSVDVTLRKMSPGEYITHPEFELICCSVYDSRRPELGSRCHFGETAIRAALLECNVEDAIVIAHNGNGFDGIILVWKLDLHPRMFGCTLSMARMVCGHETALSLGHLVKHFGIGEKRAEILNETRGKHLAEFAPEEIHRMAVYCDEDNDQCRALFSILSRQIPRHELLRIDATARARIYPELEIDKVLLTDALAREKAQKNQDLIELASYLGITEPTPEQTFAHVKSLLMSNIKFAELLEGLGVDVPMKSSPRVAGKLIPAFAKTDEGMQELVDSENELVAMAANARISTKSTLLETRIVKIIKARETSYALPCPYKFAGAKVTCRWSGEEYNMQNLPRINKKRPRNSDALRQSIVSPSGRLIGVADQSGIELRVNHHLWRVQRSCAMYAESPTADLYRDFASARWGIDPTVVSVEQRQVGKVSHLQLQFGSGALTFQRTARVQGGLNMELTEAETITYEWRRTYQEIPRGWERCQEALNYVAEGAERPIDPGELCWTCKEGIRLPTGHIIRYPHLRQALLHDERTGKDKWEWVYGVGRFTRRIYGPKVTENIVQAMGRDIVAEDADKFFLETGYWWKAMTHDELIYVWPEHHAPELLNRLQAQMRTRRTWWPDLVLWSEGGLGKRYSEAH